MTKFEYGKTVRDSFRIAFNNPLVFLPSVLVLIASTLIMPLYYKLVDSEGVFNASILSNVSLILTVVFGYIFLFIFSYFAMGWTFSMIGQLGKENRLSLSNSLREAPLKGLFYFAISIIIAVFLVVLILILLLLGVLTSTLIAYVSKALMIGWIVILAIAAIVIIAYFLFSIFYIVPILSLTNENPIQTIILSYKHFINNKMHTFALFGIILLMGLGLSVIMLPLLFMVLIYLGGGLNYGPFMYGHPYLYSLINNIFMLPLTLLQVWGFLFTTLAYARSPSAQYVKNIRKGWKTRKIG